ncbi:hypothetical protein D3C79_598780 [compost metagenome]
MFGDVDAWDFFSAQTNARHRRHGLRRVLARSGFGRQHYGVGAIQHGVRHVHDFGAGWHRVGDHRFHHLGRGNDGAVQRAGATDQFFLNADQFRIADFNAQVTTGDHHYVGSQDDVVHCFVAAHGFGAFNFRNDLGVATCIARQTACVVQVFAGTREGNRQIVDADFCRGNDIGFIFLGQGFCGQATAQLVDAFVVGQRAANGHFGKHFHALNFEHFQLYAAVIEQQYVAGYHVGRQAFIVDTDFFFIAFAFCHVGIEQKFVTDIEEDFAFLKGGNTDFRPLQVAQNSDVTPQFGSDFAHFVCASLVIFRAAMGKVEPNHVSAGSNDLFKIIVAVSSRA